MTWVGLPARVVSAGTTGTATVGADSSLIGVVSIGIEGQTADAAGQNGTFTAGSTRQDARGDDLGGGPREEFAACAAVNFLILS